MAPVAIGVLATKGCDFDALNQQNSEVRANLLSVWIKLKNLGGNSVSGYVVILRVGSQEKVSDTAPNEVRAVARRA